MRTTDIEAAVCIVASDGVWRDPGERWACPADEAEGLIASGAAVRVEPAPPDPPGARADGPSEASQLTRVKGIGPNTAADLLAAGVETLADLAALSDEQVAGLDVEPGVQRRIRDDWRGQAAQLIAVDAEGPS